MKMLFKLYLLGQLIAMPFMIGAIGDAFSSSDAPSSGSSPRVESVTDLTASGLTSAAGQDLCDLLAAGEELPILDNYQQLVYADAYYYDDAPAVDCFADELP